MGISVDVTISADLKRKLTQLYTAMEPEKVAAAVGAQQRGWVGKNFDQRGIEEPWKPLSDFTLMARSRGGDAPLQDTGRLKQSFSYVVMSGGKIVRVGSNVRYAEYHETGTGPITPKSGKFLAIPTANGVVFLRGTSGIPQRKMLPSIKMAQELAVKVIDQLIKRALSRG